MPIEHRKDGALVSGYLDTDATRHPRDSVLVRTRARYDAELRSHRFGLLGACDIVGDDWVQVRPVPPPVPATTQYLLGLLLSGSGTLEQSGHAMKLQCGEFVLYTGIRPFQLELNGPYRYLVMTLDAATTSLAQATVGATADARPSRTPAGRVLAAALTELVHSAPGLGPVSRREVGEHIAYLLRTVIRDVDRGHEQSPLLGQILEYLDRHLAEDLSPAAVAAAHHVSLRYLHHLFRDRGETVCEHIRRRRLERIRRDLADPDLIHLPVYSVAARWGLRDPSHFGKLFRAEFAISPRRFRDQVLDRGQASHHRLSTGHARR
ncbi:AraC family transcriptional regulator [Kibdelosporangium aridum]|uniref:AraC family transcriptional regulator n=1 Tax=Kibdelosporangium aridum TaxID=2030 RepID=A0A428Z2Y4_KIBAR|nr:AraC family transcriptional regulator [Kibdelosporangium aridum]RSM80042.1 AraC family transcriptional regulator [Kibdelosporangium aridum]